MGLSRKSMFLLRNVVQALGCLRSCIKRPGIHGKIGPKEGKGHTPCTWGPPRTAHEKQNDPEQGGPTLHPTSVAGFPGDGQRPRWSDEKCSAKLGGEICLMAWKGIASTPWSAKLSDSSRIPP